MKNTKRLLAILLCIILTSALLISCKKSDSSAEDGISETKEVAETSEPKDSADNPENQEEIVTPEALVVLPDSYTWVIDPGKYQGDIRPLYDFWVSSVYNTGIYLLSNDEGNYLIDQNGDIKTVLNGNDFNYCSCDQCNTITNHYNTVVDPETLIPEEKCTEHGGVGESVYTYDKDSGELFYEYPSKYVAVKEDLAYAVVEICTATPLEEYEKEYYNIDRKYECSDGYGMVVNGKLVLSGYDMYSKFSCGVTAFCKNGKWGYFDSNGNKIFSCQYEPHYAYSLDWNYDMKYIPFHATEGIILLTRDGKSAYGNAEGNLLTDFIFDAATPVYNNKAWVKTSDGWGVIELSHNYTNTTEDSDFMASAINTVQEHLYD